MQDLSDIRLQEADESLKGVSYDISRAAYFDLIARIHGWNEEKHFDYHERYWVEQRPHIIYRDETPIGTIRLQRDNGTLEISQFCILPAYHNQGIGSRVLRNILDNADASSTLIKLTVMHQNPARALYERHGFSVVRSDEMLLHMERPPGATTSCHSRESGNPATHHHMDPESSPG